jgi:hypothetical protein
MGIGSDFSNRIVAFALAAALAGACKARTDEGKDAASKVQQPNPEDVAQEAPAPPPLPEEKPFTAAEPNLVPLFFAGIVGAYADDPPVEVFPLKLEEGKLVAGKGIRLPRWERTYPALSVEGPWLLLGDGSSVERIAPFGGGGKKKTCKLEEQPSALFGYHDLCFVGLGGRVEKIDFSSDAPEAVPVHREEGYSKPVDFFTRVGGKWLVAVDDKVFPKFGFFFTFAPGGVAGHVFSASLPTGPNETYLDVASSGERFFIASVFGVQTGSGSKLYDCAVKGAGVECAESGEWFSRVGVNNPKVSLLAGEKTTTWYGMGIVGSRIFIGAGERGILSMPLSTPGSGVLAHPAGLACLDLVVMGDSIVALVLADTVGGKKAAGDVPFDEALGKNDRLILVLSWDEQASKLVETARLEPKMRLDALER